MVIMKKDFDLFDGILLFVAGFATLLALILIYSFVLSFTTKEENYQPENSSFQLKVKEEIGGRIYKVIEHKETGKMFIMNTGNGDLILLK